MVRGSPDYLPPRSPRTGEAAGERRVRRRLSSGEEGRSPAQGAQRGVSQTQTAVQGGTRAAKEERGDIRPVPTWAYQENEAGPTAGLLPGRDEEEPTVFIEGLSGYMAFERALIMDEYGELLKAEQQKAHMRQEEIDRLKVEGLRVAKISKMNVEKGRRFLL
ncbi:hypothetical protein U1Q18_007088 [Sarracenia purpurea var. burkii]